MRARLLAMLVSLSMALGCLGLAPLAALADEADQLVVVGLAGEQEVAAATSADGSDESAVADDTDYETDDSTAEADVDATDDGKPADITAVDADEATAADRQAVEDPAAHVEPVGDAPVDEQGSSQELVGSDDEPEPTSFTYRHDPRENPSAMRDAVVNPNAPYGFSPSPDGRLAAYASADWTNPEAVEGWRKARIDYHMSMAELYFLVIIMDYNKASVEEIARAVSQRRNELRIKAYKDDPEGLERMKQRNLEVYGNEMGGTPEYFYEKYGSWDRVIWGSVSVNSGMDACLGLYDDFYRLYALSGQVPMDTVLPEDRGGDNDPFFPFYPDDKTPDTPSDEEKGEPSGTTPAPADPEPAVQPTADAAQPVAETQVASVTQSREGAPTVASTANPAKVLPATGDVAQGNEAALLMGLSTLLLCVGSALSREERKAA